MSEKTNIAWATHTASPWFGCTEESPGCAHCYARELTLQKKWAGWGDQAARVRSKGFWKEAYRLNKKAGIAHLGYEAAVGAGKWAVDMCASYGMTKPTRPRMFTSLMDWLDPRVPIEWLADFLKVIHDCRNLDWLLLTKRPELFESRMLGVYFCNTNIGQSARQFANSWRIKNGIPHNVWFGVTVENQEMAAKRIPTLLSIPARVRWLSCEPLLGSLDLEPYLGWKAERAAKSLRSKVLSDALKSLPDVSGADWVVVGGESGSKRRDCGVEAIVSVAEQCKAAGVPVFVKQDCAQRPGQQGRLPEEIWKRKELPAIRQEGV